MTTTDNTVTVPTVLPNGAEVHEFHLLHPGGNGYRPHGIALCHYPHAIGEWVTWVIYRDENNRWHAENGHYLTNLTEAVADFRERAPGYES